MATEDNKNATALDAEKLGADESSVTQALHVDPEKEKKLLRKLDLYLAPIMTIVFLTAYLDRSNIGNAASAGMLEDINMSSSDLGSTSCICHYTISWGRLTDSW